MPLLYPTRAYAASAGFITSANDTRARISACAGKLACASGHIAARELAHSTDYVR